MSSIIGETYIFDRLRVTNVGPNTIFSVVDVPHSDLFGREKRDTLLSILPDSRRCPNLG